MLRVYIVNYVLWLVSYEIHFKNICRVYFFAHQMHFTRLGSMHASRYSLFYKQLVKDQLNRWGTYT